MPPEFPARGIPRFRDVWLDGNPSLHALWLEQRPEERGRTALFAAPLAAPQTARRVSPPEFDVRSRVNEYGGGAVCVDGGDVIASSGQDGRVWHFRWAEPDATLCALTPPGPWRFADFRPDRMRTRVYAVVETEEAGLRWPRQCLGAIPFAGGSPRSLVEGADFYAAPRPSADGRLLAWLQWWLPALPWETTELFVGTVAADGAITHSRRIGGDTLESIVDPTWAPDGSLCFASDRHGSWNLYRVHPTGGPVHRLAPLPAEMALPHWVFGRPLFGFTDDGTLVAAAIRDGRTSLWRLARDDWQRPRSASLWRDTTNWSSFEPLRVHGNDAVAIAAGPERAASIVTLDLTASENAPRVLRAAMDEPHAFAEYRAEALALPARDGGTIAAFLYRPDRAGPVPAIVSVHGGPTAQAAFAPDATILFWLSQGFAWLDVNYRGSTGYGRAYREHLRHRWGDVDVADCEDAARALVESGLFDAERVAIRGGSAGGYTALRAAARDNVFSAATSAYGVSDLVALVRDSHKFEAGYGNALLGSDDAAKLRERSPLFAPETIRIPVLFLQGLDDTVVPAPQSERMYRALRERGIDAEYVAFEGEGHGFRRAETVQRAIAAELAFYRRVFAS